MDLVSRQADERGIKVEQTIEIEHRKLLGSSLYLKRMLMNILSNAVKYNKDYGNIDLSCKEIPSHSTESTMLEFTCRDTGIGMSSEFKEHVFESFAREQKGGASKFGGSNKCCTFALVFAYIWANGGVVRLYSICFLKQGENTSHQK